MSKVAISQQPRLTIKQEAFARLVAQDVEQTDAYYRAYGINKDLSNKKQHKMIKERACRTVALDYVTNRISELRQTYNDNRPLTSRDEQLRILLQTQSIAASHLQKTRKNVDKDGNETEEATFNRSAADTIVKCAEAINKMCGYNEPDKLDTTLKIEFVRPQALQGADSDNDNMIEIDDYEDLSE